LQLDLDFWNSFGTGGQVALRDEPATPEEPWKPALQGSLKHTDCARNGTAKARRSSLVSEGRFTTTAETPKLLEHLGEIGKLRRFDSRGDKQALGAAISLDSPPRL